MLKRGDLVYINSNKALMFSDHTSKDIIKQAQLNVSGIVIEVFHDNLGYFPQSNKVILSDGSVGWVQTYHLRKV